jgi:hypothetical protein
MKDNSTVAVPMTLALGLYGVLLTELLTERLEGVGRTSAPELIDLRNAEAADRIALHLESVVERATETLPERERGREPASIILEWSSSSNPPYSRQASMRRMADRICGACGNHTLPTVKKSPPVLPLSSAYTVIRGAGGRCAACAAFSRSSSESVPRFLRISGLALNSPNVFWIVARAG